MGQEPTWVESSLANSKSDCAHAHYAADADLRASATHRLAFRELGLAIGLAAVSKLPDLATRTGLDPYLRLREEIERFWIRPEHRETRAWLDHEDINDVMLATSLAPDGFLRRNHIE